MHFRRSPRSRGWLLPIRLTRLFHQGDLDLPIRFSLKGACGACRTRERVVDKRDIVPDEDFVLDRHAFTDEGMTRYLAPLADLGIL
jgi:hypothetical protein